MTVFERFALAHENGDSEWIERMNSEHRRQIARCEKAAALLEEALDAGWRINAQSLVPEFIDDGEWECVQKVVDWMSAVSDVLPEFQCLVWGADIRRKRIKKRRLRRWESYEEYLLSEEWKWKRDFIIARDGYKCALCPSVMNLNVHHSIYSRWGAEKPIDLITLCRKCHAKHHDKFYA